MPSPPYRILIVDDEVRSLEALERLFAEDYTVLRAAGAREALAILKQEDVALILADQRMPGMSGVQFLEQAIALRPDAIRIIITGYPDVEHLIEAINTGRVYQYILKPWNPRELRLTIQRALSAYRLSVENRRLTEELRLANVRLEQENRELKREVVAQYRFDGIVGTTPAFLNVMEALKRIASSDITVLLQGETGTGKELLARAIHYNSCRREKKFVAQNCGAVPEGLLESELFGHVKGAFTGAVADRKGLFEEADGGTVFLDEISEMTPALQVKLLRVLQEGEIKPVGSTRARHVGVRIISATNKNLEEEMERVRFRADLFYRLNVFTVTVPPLRERRDDIPLLAHHFLEKFSRKMGKRVEGFTPETLAILQAYGYPGNVRELEHEVERAVALTPDGALVPPDVLSSRLAAAGSRRPSPNGFTLRKKIELLEVEEIRQALTKHSSNKTRAARDLGLTRVGLNSKLRRYGLDLTSERRAR